MVDPNTKASCLSSGRAAEGAPIDGGVLESKLAEGESSASPSTEVLPTVAGYNALRANLTEVAQYCRTLFMAHLAVNGYALIVLIGLQDDMFFKPRNQIKLPVIDASVPLAWFMPALALLALFVFVYWQMYMRKMWLLANRLSLAADRVRGDKDFVPPTGDYRLPWIAFFVADEDRLLRLGAFAFGVFQWVPMAATQLACFMRTIRLGARFEHWKHGLPWSPAFGALYVVSLALTWWLSVEQKRVALGTHAEERPFLRRSMYALVLCISVLLPWYSQYHPLQLAHLRTSMTLNRLDLSGANLRHAHLQDAYLIEANLSHANLHRADLRGAMLIQANLSSASVYEANLSQAHLNGANLRRAHLGLAQLSGTDFSSNIVHWKTNLNGARFDEAVFNSTMFCSTSLEHAHGLSQLQITQVVGNAATVPPIDLVISDKQRVGCPGYIYQRR